MCYKQVSILTGISTAACAAINRGHGMPKRNPNHYKTYPVKEDYFDIIDTEERAYWLGYIVADGCVHSGGKRVSISSTGKDKAHLEKFKAAIESDAPLYPGRGSGPKKEYSVIVHSGAFWRSLFLLGVVPQKTWTVKPWQGPPELMRHYWRGVVDGDGWITYQPDKGRYCVGLCGNKAIVAGFHNFAREHTGNETKIVQYLKHKYTKPFFHIAYGSINATKKLAALLYEDTTVSLSRKMKLAEGLMSMRWVKDVNKISMDTAREIVKIYKYGYYSIEDLAKTYGIAQNVVKDSIHARGRFKPLRILPDGEVV